MSRVASEDSIATKLARVTAAVSVGFAGQAHAALISTDTGAPFTLSTATSPQSVNIDLNKDGITDYTLASSATAVSVTGAGTNKTDIVKLNNVGLVRSHATVSQNDIPNYNLKTGSWPIINLLASPYTTFSSTPLDLALEFTGSGGVPYLGYIQGTAALTAATNEDGPPRAGAFTVTDYGYDTTPVPEPTSLALLAAGAAGVFAFRRRSIVRAA